MPKFEVQGFVVNVGGVLPGPFDELCDRQIITYSSSRTYLTRYSTPTAYFVPKDVDCLHILLGPFQEDYLNGITQLNLKSILNDGKCGIRCTYPANYKLGEEIKSHIRHILDGSHHNTCDVEVLQASIQTPECFMYEFFEWAKSYRKYRKRSLLMKCTRAICTRIARFRTAHNCSQRKKQDIRTGFDYLQLSSVRRPHKVRVWPYRFDDNASNQGLLRYTNGEQLCTF